MATPRIVAIGEVAAAALAQSGGALRLIPGFPETPYRYAGSDIVWVGVRGEAHPRAVFLDAPLHDMHLAWNEPAPAPTLGHQHAGLTRASARPLFAALARRCRELGEPRGWGTVLVDGVPPFPLDMRADAAHALAAAVAADDADAFSRSAMRLLGVGGGLTPSGDDFVGATLFTLHHLGLDDARWDPAIHALNEATGTRTHAISAALFADLARGESFEPLHKILDATCASDLDAMLDAARTLTAIGHSSGWDMLTGMIAAATGTLHHTSH